MAKPGTYAGVPRRSPGFDAVVSNPPFQNQLRSRTAMDRGLAALVRARAGGDTSAYTDAAAVFLRLALELVREGGSAGMLIPQSILASRDAGLVRARIGTVGRLSHLWVSGEHAFDRALVSTCGVVLARQSESIQWRLTRSVSLGLQPLQSEELDRTSLANAPTWAHLMAPARGLPNIDFEPAGVLSDIATATADFRDEYYALRGLIVDAPADEARPQALAQVVTSGLIGLAGCYWGEKPTRIHKARFLAPCVDLRRLGETRAHTWAKKRLVPKVLLATQTRAIEVYVDEAGASLPCLPVITVVPREPHDLWRIASAAASPVCTLVASRRHGGTALTGDAIKLAARDVLALPLPGDRTAWERGTKAFCALQSNNRAAHREELLSSYGSAMCEAYGLSAQDSAILLGWWMQRARNDRARRERKKTAPA